MNRRRTLAAVLPVIVGVMMLVAACRTAPDEEEPPAVEPVDIRGLELLRAPADGSVVDTDEIPITIALGNVSPDRVEYVIVRYTPGDEVFLEPETGPEGLTFLLPLAGLEDGERYRVSLILRLIDGTEHPVGARLFFTLMLGLPAPVADPEELYSLDPRPRLSLRERSRDEGAVPTAEVVLQVDGATVPVEVEEAGGLSYGDKRWTVRPRAGVVTREEITAGATRTWTARFASPRGVLGPVSKRGRIHYDMEKSAPEILSARSGDATLVAVPGFSWEAVHGAVAYELEYGWSDTEMGAADQTYSDRTDRNAFRPSSDVLDRFFQTGSPARLWWRVRAINSLDNTTAWTAVDSIRYEVLAPRIAPVLPPGARVVLTMGAPGDTPGARDNETPPVDVLIDRPFGMGRNLLTVEVVAELFNQEIRRGAAYLTEDDILLDGESGEPLLLLRNLDFGSQFGLLPGEQGSDRDRRIVFAPEYRAHPAVGVTWYGAIRLMNRLSYLEARDPVYAWTWSGDDYLIEADPDADGYRLPTEAEWALAAAQRTRFQENEEIESLVVHRELSTTDLRGINYLRSGDAWEDPLPPYTRSGGPTSPVGVLGRASPVGLLDLLGNAWEWVWDWYEPQRENLVDEDREDRRLPRNFAGPPAAAPDIYGRELRVVRGGAWNTPREELRPTMRGAFAPTAASHSIGVRPARSLADTRNETPLAR